MKIQDLVNYYEMHYDTEQSSHTLKNYRNAWKKYRTFMQLQYGLTQDQDIIENTNWSSAQLFKNYMLRDGLNPKTVNNALSGVRMYFECLVHNHLVSNNPFKEIVSASTKNVNYERPYLESEDFDLLLETIATKEKGRKQDGFELTALRDQLAVGILLSCGLRIHELLKIKINEIQSNGELWVLGKGKKLRKVCIGQSNMVRLKAYLNVRSNYAQDECDTLFISRYGKGMSPQSFNKNLKKYLERAGLDTSVSAHGLRASSATNYLQQGVRPTQIAELLGHSDVKTTLKHYAKEDNTFDFVR